jgi:hypothetical protein
MKTAPASVLFLALSAAIALGQGPLTPPGAPAPTMKSLDQIEARTPIPASPAVPVAGPHFTISTPGSYYLTGNVVVSTGDGIQISSDDVTLDLNGFKISSTLTGNKTGFAVAAIGDRSRLTVRNGSITSGTTVASGSGVIVQAGFLNGIFSSNTINQSLVENVHIIGMGSDGIYLDAQGLVQNFTVRNCGGNGIHAQEVMNVSVENCGLIAIYTRNATNCTGISLSGYGIQALGNVTNCIGNSNSSTGLICVGNASNSVGNSNSGTGLICGENATNCAGYAQATNGLSIGLSVGGVASFCRGYRNSGIAIQAANAIGCAVNGLGTVSAPLKSLGTP